MKTDVYCCEIIIRNSFSQYVKRKLNSEKSNIKISASKRFIFERLEFFIHVISDNYYILLTAINQFR